MPADAFALIRSLAESHPARDSSSSPEEDDAKVLARSREAFVSERPGKWLTDYRRRCGHRHTGFDSLPQVPYRPFAGLRHTDVYHLIADTWDLSLSSYSREIVKNITSFWHALLAFFHKIEFERQ